MFTKSLLQITIQALLLSFFILLEPVHGYEACIAPDAIQSSVNPSTIQLKPSFYSWKGSLVYSIIILKKKMHVCKENVGSSSSLFAKDSLQWIESGAFELQQEVSLLAIRKITSAATKVLPTTKGPFGRNQFRLLREKKVIRKRGK